MANTSFQTKAPLDMKPLMALIAQSEDWLIHQTLQYAKQRGYTKYTSTLLEAWRISISGLSAPLLSALQANSGFPEFGPDDDFESDPIASFGILEARRHRERGITLEMFLGLMKYYRQSYVDLVVAAEFQPEEKKTYRYFMDRFFDRVELGFCREWSRRGEERLVEELQEKNRSLTNEKNKYLTVFESLQTPAVLLDENQNIINLNAAWAKTFGMVIEPGGVYYEPVSLSNEVMGQIRQLSTLINREKAASSLERKIHTVAGPRHFQININKMLDVSDKYAGAVITLNDITKRVTAEGQLKKHKEYLEALVSERTTELEKTSTLLKKHSQDRREMESVNFELHRQLLHAQKMEAIGTLAGGIAHDFNNILSAILGYSELAQEEVPDHHKAQAHLKEVLIACHRAKELVLQILTFSHQDNLKFKPIRLHVIVKEVLRLLRATIPTNIEIRQEINTDCGAVLAAPTQIHQILMNLCGNAYHAMRETSGVLTVSLQPVNVTLESDEANHGIRPGVYAMLSVRDTGHGMDAAVRARIFEPYFTTKEKGQGTGLGLSVIHGIIKNHNGYITVFSEPGKGSVFTVYLPVTLCQDGLFDSNTAESVERGTEHILIVDDEEVLAVMWQQHLELLGYRVTAYSNSEAALNEFRRRPQDFDLVLTDMNMPKITGIHLSKGMMKIRPDIPIILSTGYSDLISEEKAKEMGIRAFMLKPILGRELAKTIRSLLDTKGAAGPPPNTVFHHCSKNTPGFP